MLVVRIKFSPRWGIFTHFSNTDFLVLSLYKWNQRTNLELIHINVFNSFGFIDFGLVLFPLSFLWAHTFIFISSSIFGVNVRAGWQIYIFRVKSCLGQKVLLSNFKNFNFKKYVLCTGSLYLAYIFRVFVKLTIFLMLPVSALTLLLTIKLYLKKLWRSLALMSLKLKK